MSELDTMIPYQCNGCKYLVIIPKYSKDLPMIRVDTAICNCPEIMEEHKACCSHTYGIIGVRTWHAAREHCTQAEHYEKKVE